MADNLAVLRRLHYLRQLFHSSQSEFWLIVKIHLNCIPRIVLDKDINS